LGAMICRQFAGMPLPPGTLILQTLASDKAVADRCVEWRGAVRARSNSRTLPGRRRSLGRSKVAILQARSALGTSDIFRRPITVGRSVGRSLRQGEDVDAVSLVAGVRLFF
jgi:hypothetical protein